MRKSEDFEFANDLALLSHCLQDLRDKVDLLNEVLQRSGLKITQEKSTGYKKK
jgi:hypothetical protein